MATRPKRSKVANKENSAATLIEALKFISVAQHKTAVTGQEYKTHCVLSNNWAIAFDGLLTVGHKIEEELSACPHTETLLSALSKCGQTMSITQLESGKLSIKSDKFKALVPCQTGEYLPTVSATADAPIAPIDDRLKKAFEVCGLAVEEEQIKNRVIEASLLVNPNVCAGTNGRVAIEYWHGNDLPPDMVLPGVAAEAIAKCGKKLVRFGYSGGSATFYFEDESFIKTQLYVEKWPNYQGIFKDDVNAWPLPPTFYEAVNTLAPFVDPEKPWLFMHKGMMQTADKAEDGATYEVEGLAGGKVFTLPYLKIVEPLIQKIDFGKTKHDHAFFFGENLRGAIAAVIL